MEETNLNIYIDGTPLSRKIDGIGSYSINLLSSLASIYKKHSFTIILFRGDLVPEIADKFSNISTDTIPYKRKAYSATFKLLKPLPINKHLTKNPDYVIYPNFVCYPYISGARKLTIVHDLSYVDLPEYTEPKNLKFLRKFVPFSIKDSSLVGSITKYSAKRVAEENNLNVNDVVVIPPSAPDHKEVSKEKSGSILTDLGISKKYILFIGTLQPRKNIVNIIRSYSKLNKELREEYSLVLAGGAGWNSDEINKEIEKAKTNFDVITTGYINETQKSALYSNCSVFFFPSRYEGFGMPVLEAMEQGVPVIASSNTGITEAAGNAALFVDPDNTNDMEGKLRKVLVDTKLQKELANNGYKQVKNFSWDNSARILGKAIGLE